MVYQYLSDGFDKIKSIRNDGQNIKKITNDNGDIIFLGKDEFGIPLVIKDILYQLQAGIEPSELEYDADEIQHALFTMSVEALPSAFHDDSLTSQFEPIGVDAINGPISNTPIYIIPRAIIEGEYLSNDNLYNMMGVIYDYLSEIDHMISFYMGYVPILIYDMPFEDVNNNLWRNDGNLGVGSFLTPISEANYNQYTISQNYLYSRYTGKFALSIMDFMNGEWYILEEPFFVKIKLNEENFVKYYRGPKQLVANVYENGKLVTESLEQHSSSSNNLGLIFTLNNVSYMRYYNPNNGGVRLNVVANPGEYPCTTTYISHGQTFSLSSHVTVLEVLFLPEQTNFKMGDNFIVTVLDSNTGEPLVGKGSQYVSFNFDEEDIDIPIDSEGHAALPLNKTGTYRITSSYNSRRRSATISISPSILYILSASDLTKVYGTADQFIATLTDLQGNPISGVKVAFDIHNIIYQRTTDANGQAKLNIKLSEGQYIIKTSYDGAETISNIITVIG